MDLGDFADDREAEPGAVLVSGVARLEDPGPFVGRNTDPVVFDVEPVGAVEVADGDLEFVVLGGPAVLRGVLLSVRGMRSTAKRAPQSVGEVCGLLSRCCAVAVLVD